MSKYREQMDDLFLKYGLYEYNKKLKKGYETRGRINKAFENTFSGNVCMLYASDELTQAIVGCLYTDNRRKVYVCRERQLIVSSEIRKKYRCFIDLKHRSKLKSFGIRLIRSCLNLHWIRGREWINVLDNRSLEDAVRDLEYTYFDQNKLLLQYQNTNDYDERIKLHKAIIVGFIYIRDFLYAKEWIDKLAEVSHCKDDYDFFLLMWNEIEELLKCLRADIKRRRHIVLNWIDGLRRDELCNMQYVEGRVNSGIRFNRMYSVTPYTNGTMKTIFWGKYLIDDRIFAKKPKDYYNSELQLILQAHDYQLRISSSCFNNGYFYNDYMLELGKVYPDRATVPSTMIQFDAICNMAESSNNTFTIIHNLGETHSPHANPFYFHGDKKVGELRAEERLLQYKASEEYLDKQLEFYGKIYSNVGYEIFMSDHGQRRFEKSVSIFGTHGVAFGIAGNDLTEVRKTIESVTSLVDFAKLMELLLDEQIAVNEIERRLARKCALVQMDDPYAKSRVVEMKNWKEIDIFQSIQYRGCVSDEDCYIKYPTGEEYYHIGNEDVNEINNPKYVERIKELRKLTGNKFIDIRKEKEYKNALQLYKEKEFSKQIEFV